MMFGEREINISLDEGFGNGSSIGVSGFSEGFNFGRFNRMENALYWPKDGFNRVKRGKLYNLLQYGGYQDGLDTFSIPSFSMTCGEVLQLYRRKGFPDCTQWLWGCHPDESVNGNDREKYYGAYANDVALGKVTISSEAIKRMPNALVELVCYKVGWLKQGGKCNLTEDCDGDFKPEAVNRKNTTLGNHRSTRQRCNKCRKVVSPRIGTFISGTNTSVKEFVHGVVLYLEFPRISNRAFGLLTGSGVNRKTQIADWIKETASRTYSHLFSPLIASPVCIDEQFWTSINSWSFNVVDSLGQSLSMLVPNRTASVLRECFLMAVDENDLEKVLCLGDGLAWYPSVCRGATLIQGNHQQAWNFPVVFPVNDIGQPVTSSGKRLSYYDLQNAPANATTNPIEVRHADYSQYDSSRPSTKQKVQEHCRFVDFMAFSRMIGVPLIDSFVKATHLALFDVYTGPLDLVYTDSTAMDTSSD